MTSRPAGNVRPVARPVWVEVTSVASDYNGVFFPQVPRDAHVAKGATIGLVKDVLNRPIAEIKAPEAGIIMFIRALPSLKKGDTIASLGVIKQEPK
jgi:predicted deacylase